MQPQHDQRTWSTLFAGGAPLGVIADHLEEIDHPLAPLFRSFHDKPHTVLDRPKTLPDTYVASLPWHTGDTRRDGMVNQYESGALHPDVKVSTSFAGSKGRQFLGIEAPGRLLVTYKPTSEVQQILHHIRPLPEYQQRQPEQLARPLTKAQLNTGAVPALHGTRLLYQLKSLHELGDEDLSARVNAALKNRGDAKAGQSAETNWKQLGEALKRLNHPMAEAYNWHRIGQALDVDAAVKEFVEKNVKSSANNLFRVTAKHVGIDGKADQATKDRFHAALQLHLAKKFARPDEIYATDPITGEQKTRPRQGFTLDKKHFSREMVERSLHRLAAQEDDREVVEKSKPKDWREYLSLLPTAINVSKRGKTLQATPSKLRTAPEQYARVQPNSDLAALVKQYHERHREKFGLDLPVEGGSFIWTPEQSKLTAKLYAAAKHLPNHPVVRKAYDQFKTELLAQYQHLADAGYTMEPWTQPGQPYKNSTEMADDVRKNKRIYYFPTDAGFGSGEELPNHPLNQDSGVMLGGRPAKWNDLLRAVHDIWGHAMSGNQFGAKGELAAWGDHARSFSPLARAALTAETHGQNSWVNFGPHSHLPVTERPFADQKAIILPKNAVPKFQLSRFPVPRPNITVPANRRTELTTQHENKEEWVDLASAPNALTAAISDHLEEQNHPLAPVFQTIFAQGTPHPYQGQVMARQYRTLVVPGTIGSNTAKIRVGTTGGNDPHLVVHIQAGNNEYSTRIAPGSLPGKKLAAAVKRYRPEREVTRGNGGQPRPTHQMSATRPATVNLSKLGQQKVEILRKLATEAKLKVLQVAPSEELGTSGIRSGVVSEIAHGNEPDAAEYVAHWFGLLANPDTAHAFHVSPEGKDTLLRIRSPLAPTKALENLVGVRSPNSIIRAVAHPLGSEVYAVNAPNPQTLLRLVNANTADTYTGIHSPLRGSEGTTADRRKLHREAIGRYEDATTAATSN